MTCLCEPLAARTAHEGHPGAQRALGLMYANGQGVPRDDVQAVAWYRKAADQGDSTAQVDLALAYEKGRGVRKDKSEAEKWLKKASEQGDPIGSFEYGYLFLSSHESSPYTLRGMRRDGTRKQDTHENEVQDRTLARTDAHADWHVDDGQVGPTGRRCSSGQAEGPL